MDSETLALISETIEQSCEVNKNLINSEIYINEGELGRSQAVFGLARDLINTMKSDIYQELLESFCLSLPQPNCEDFNSLELCKELTLLTKNCGTLVGMFIDDEVDAVISIIQTKIAQNISNVLYIANQLFN